jgi:hypothetical protein
MGRVAQTPLAAVGLLTPAPRSAATTAHQADPCVTARHVIGRLLDLSHISWRTCVADQLADHKIGARGEGQKGDEKSLSASEACQDEVTDG